MNRKLPPGDRGHRSGDPRFAYRSGRAVPRACHWWGELRLLQTAWRVGERCATVGSRSLGLRGVGVMAKAAVIWQGAQGIGAEAESPPRGRSRRRRFDEIGRQRPKEEYPMSMIQLGLVRYDQMCNAIAECSRVDEAKEIRDQAKALEVYAAQANNTEAERKACEIRIRAERRAGQLLKAANSAPGVREAPAGN
jgi:hypothetical protein